MPNILSYRVVKITFSMRPKALVSAIITTKNSERTVGTLLESLKSQTYLNLETILVDNSSSDETVEIAKKFTNNVFKKGPERSAQRNFGVKKAKGKYVLIVDADMELTKRVVESCVRRISDYKALIIPEKTVGEGLLVSIRKFEREMYMGDPTIEVARFFEKKVFNEFGGYDLSLTGTEDYDLPKRIMDRYGKNSIGWAKGWILHHEAGLTLIKQLKKKFYYASKSVLYVKKHPDLILTQGNMLFRAAYIRNWKKFLQRPLIAASFIFVRVLEAFAAFFGFIKGALTF